MAVTFTPFGDLAVDITPIPGTLQYGDGHDDRGGSNIPNARGGSARNGSLEALIDDGGLTEAAAMALRSGVGEGDVDITGADIDADMHSFDALIDVEITGDAVQVARISWKGTITP